jgi:hypothetical protein
MSGNEPEPGHQPEPGYWEQQAQQGYGYVPPGQPGYPPYPAYGYAPPRHPEANKVLALGLVAIVGGMSCYLPILVAPFAWVIGNRVTREIDASAGRYGGHSEAQTGKILGIVGNGLLVLGLLVLTLFITLGVAGVFDESGTSNV